MNRLLYCFILLLISSCVSEKGATHYFINKHPEKLALLCAAKFPVKESFKAGVPIIIRDTIKGDSVDCPTVVTPTGQVWKPKVKCPDYTKEKEIIRDTIFQENTARVDSLQTQLDNQRTLRIKSETKSENLYSRLTRYKIALALLTAASVILLIFLFK